MISEKDKKILELFSVRVRGLFPQAEVWAFGSRARGTAAWDSDFDICVVLDRQDRSADRKIREIAWEISFECGCVITTLVLDRYQFDEGPLSESSLKASILQEGVPA